MTRPDPETPFRSLPDRLRDHARGQGARTALVCGGQRLDFAALDAAADRAAAALQHAGVRPGGAVALCAATSIAYLVAFVGALRAGAAVVPLPVSGTPEALRAMVRDAVATVVLTDASTAAAFADGTAFAADTASTADANIAATASTSASGATTGATTGATVDTAATDPAAHVPPVRWRLDGGDPLDPFAGHPGAGAPPRPVAIDPAMAFNLIYSSGTTGRPKGIVQPHGMRAAHVERNRRYGYRPGSTTLVSTPLYSNTTLVSLLPALALGGTVVLMPRFDAGAFLQLAAHHRATHAMLVPVQYQRLMAHPDFDAADLSAFEFKFCTSAPFAAALKAEVLARWPGDLIEYYGLTEGGGTCILDARAHPDKLHTVGRAAPGSEVRLIDDEGRLLPEGAVGVAGEVVGRSAAMMSGYHGLPEATREAEWFDADGRRFLRTGDIGRFDADGFLTLVDRRKDMLISGGFNVYPSDLEAVLRAHPAVHEAAVVGVPSAAWGETPVAFVVVGGDAGETAASAPAVDAEQLRAWANERLGKTQRLAALQLVDELPRSAIGKVLKRELRERAQAFGPAG